MNNISGQLDTTMNRINVMNESILNNIRDWITYAFVPWNSLNIVLQNQSLSCVARELPYKHEKRAKRGKDCHINSLAWSRHVPGTETQLYHSRDRLSSFVGEIAK